MFCNWTQPETALGPAEAYRSVALDATHAASAPPAEFTPSLRRKPKLARARARLLREMTA